MPTTELSLLNDNLDIVLVTRGKLELEFHYFTELFTKGNAPALVSLDLDPVADAERKKLNAQIEVHELQQKLERNAKNAPPKTRALRRKAAAQKAATSESSGDIDESKDEGTLETPVAAKADEFDGDKLRADMDKALAEVKEAAIEAEIGTIKSLAQKMAKMIGKTSIVQNGHPVPCTAEWFENHLSRDLMQEVLVKVTEAMQGPLETRISDDS